MCKNIIIKYSFIFFSNRNIWVSACRYVTYVRHVYDTKVLSCKWEINMTQTFKIQPMTIKCQWFPLMKKRLVHVNIFLNIK